MNQKSRTLLQLIAIFAFCFLVYTLAIDVKAPVFTSDKPYRPIGISYLESNDGLKSFHSSTTSIFTIQPNRHKRMPIKAFKHASDSKPTLFIIVRTPKTLAPHSSNSPLVEPEDNLEDNIIYLGYHGAQNLAVKHVEDDEYNYVYLNISAKKLEYKNDPTLMSRVHGWYDNKHSYFYGIPELAPTVIAELEALVSFQDEEVGQNGYNPQNLALLAYYPSSERYALVDDSLFLPHIEMEFELANVDSLDTDTLNSYYRSDGTFLRTKFKSIPNKAISKLDFNEKNQRLIKFLKQEVVPEAYKARQKAQDLLLM